MHEISFLVDWIASQFGVTDTNLLLTLVIISMVSQFIGKRIPDDKTGTLGILRDVLKAVGLYTSNRVRTGVSVADVAKELTEKDSQEAQTSEFKYQYHTDRD